MSAAAWLRRRLACSSSARCKTRIGLRRCRYAASGAAPIAPEVLEFFLGIGVPVFELYGMTENSAVATANFPGRMKLGTVGEPCPGIGFRIDPTTGEIQAKHDGVFAGYWNKPGQDRRDVHRGRLARTGDVGEWVDGTHIRIVDRIKHIIITSGGKNISPSEIENSLKTSPYISEAMVVGDGRKVPHRPRRHRATTRSATGPCGGTSRTPRTATWSRSRRWSS